MAAGNSALIEFILRTIRRDGPVNFAWFMAQALYHPEHGYYSSGRAAIGRSGDYFTSICVGPLFGRLLAAQFAEMWETLGRPKDLVLAEQGAHGGEFARDVLEAARKHHPEFFAALRYEIVEPFPIWRERQTAALADFAEKVTWADSFEQLAPFCGVHFSNELIDAMPVHLVKWTGSKWVERHVATDNDQVVFVDQPLSTPALATHLEGLPTTLPLGYETEINLAALEWMKQVAAKLTKGFVVIADYGFARDEFYASHRTTGTLQCYANQRVLSSPFSGIGQTDITAHVEWTSVAKRAEEAGLTVCGFADQHHFITGLLSGPLAAEFENTNHSKTKRALQTLLHPELLGTNFQFLVLGKNAPAALSLAGLRFAKTATAGRQI